MHVANSLKEVHSELTQEHRKIMAWVSRLEGERDVKALPHLLAELHAALVDHFSHEQFPGGLYERMGARVPAYQNDIKALIREHCMILSNARALLERSKGVGPGGESELLRDVAHMLQELGEHERREHRLVEKLKRNQEDGLPA